MSSIIGTFIPQNESPVNYLKAFGAPLYRVFDLLDFYDMYHAWWFRLLLLMLVINLVICSVDRLSATWKIIFVKIPPFRLSRYRSMKGRAEMTSILSFDALKGVYQPVVSKFFGYSRTEDTDEGFCIFGEKGRWTRLGVYIVHLSIVLLLFGGMIGSILGMEGYINIPEGETVKRVRLRGTNQLYNLGFEIRCDDFDVSFYDTGAPKEFRSSLTILEQGKPVVQKDIVVNDPLHYKGINFFQSSYGPAVPNEITLDFRSKKTGKVYSKKLAVGSSFEIPENLGTFFIMNIAGSHKFRGIEVGETIIGSLTQGNSDPIEVIVPFRYSKFDMMRGGDVIISLKNYDKRYYTGLQVTRDPSVLVVYTGFVMMIIGCFICFFMSHQSLCIDVVRDKDGARVSVSGTANKNRLGMENKVKKIVESLSRTEEEYSHKEINHG